MDDSNIEKNQGQISLPEERSLLEDREEGQEVEMTNNDDKSYSFHYLAQKQALLRVEGSDQFSFTKSTVKCSQRWKPLPLDFTFFSTAV